MSFEVREAPIDIVIAAAEEAASVSASSDVPLLGRCVLDIVDELWSNNGGIVIVEGTPSESQTGFFRSQNIELKAGNT